jgi:acetyltransferase-like isoleucine patch superfamily enzyme
VNLIYKVINKSKVLLILMMYSLEELFVKLLNLWADKKNSIHFIKQENVFVHRHALILNLSSNIRNIAVNKNSYIKQFVEIITLPEGKINIGENCHIGPNTRIWSADSIVIGDHVGIAHNVSIVDFSHKTNPYERAEEVSNLIHKGIWPKKVDIPHKPIVIEDYVAIYPNAIISSGVTIGKGAIVSAGCVVIKDVAPFTVVFGNPARAMLKIRV